MKKVLLVAAVCGTMAGAYAKHNVPQIKKIHPQAAGKLVIFNKDRDAHTFVVSGPDGKRHVVRVAGLSQAKVKKLATPSLTPDGYTVTVKKPGRKVSMTPGHMVEISYTEGGNSQFNVVDRESCAKKLNKHDCTNGLLALVNKDDAPHIFSMTTAQGETSKITVDPHQTKYLTPKQEGKQRVLLGVSAVEGTTSVVLDESNPKAVVCYDDNHSPKMWDCSPMKMRDRDLIW